MMKKYLTALLFLLASPALATEDPIVSDGLSIPTYLGAYDSTNIINSEDVIGAFTTVSGSPTVTVKHAASVFGLPGGSVVPGAKISFTGTSAPVGGLTMNGTWVIATTPDSTHFTFTHTSNATSTVSTPTANTTIAYSNFYDDGKLRFLCKYSHVAYDDPIVAPGVPGAAHLHLFYGNTLTNASSTYNSLRSSGDGTCDGGPLNRTAYWMPAMLDSSVNKVRIPIYFEWYYTDNRRDLADYISPVCAIKGGNGLLQDGRTAACPQEAIKKIERGMKAVFGFKPTAGNFPAVYGWNGMLDHSWTCHASVGAGDPIVSSRGFRYLSHRTNPSLGLTSDRATVTISIGSPAVITDVAHNRNLNEITVFNTTGTLPTGLTAGTTYYVKTILDADHYTVSTDPSVSAVNTSGSQSGVHARGCPPSGEISIRTGNPSCWDGNHDNADHYSHFAFPSQDGWGNLVCPATHPKSFQNFTVIAVWSYSGGISSANSWYLSSDRHNGANFDAGETYHWDMFWAWNDAVQEHFHEKVQGMYPSSAAGAPYIYDSATTDFIRGNNYVGGPYMRNTNDGGLGSDCTDLGMAGPCTLRSHSVGAGISDILLDIPPVRRRGKALMK